MIGLIINLPVSNCWGCSWWVHEEGWDRPRIFIYPSPAFGRCFFSFAFSRFFASLNPGEGELFPPLVPHFSPSPNQHSLPSPIDQLKWPNWRSVLCDYFLDFPDCFSKKKYAFAQHNAAGLCVFVLYYYCTIQPGPRSRRPPPKKSNTPDMFVFPPLFLHDQRALVLSVSVSINLLTAPIAERNCASTYNACVEYSTMSGLIPR